MKRSEALAEITFILDNEYDLDHPSQAELILAKLEKLGMLPPLISLPRFTQVYYDNAWEPEDE